MSQPSNLNYQLGEALRNNFNVLPDPGTGATVDLQGKQFAIVKGWGAGTYDLPNLAEGAGTVLFIYADGSQTWRNKATTTRATLASGEWAIASSVSTSDWKVQVVSGAGDDVLSQVVAALGGSAAALPIEDTGGFITGTNVETAFAELAQILLLPNTKYSTTAAASPLTASAGNLTGARNVYFQITTDGAFALTTRTATQMYGDLGAAAYVGMSYNLTIVNRGDNTVTITAGSGITTTGELTIATTTTRTYVITFTSATAATMVSVDKGTIET